MFLGRKRRRSPDREGISLKTEPRVHEFTAENVEDILSEGVCSWSLIVYCSVTRGLGT